MTVLVQSEAETYSVTVVAVTAGGSSRGIYGGGAREHEGEEVAWCEEQDIWMWRDCSWTPCYETRCNVSFHIKDL